MTESRAHAEEIGPYSEYATAHERALKEQTKGLRSIRIDKIKGRWVIRGVRTEQRDATRRPSKRSQRDSSEGNLPKWSGAAHVYSALYKVLEKMGMEQWRKAVADARKKGGRRPLSPRQGAAPSADMAYLIRSLNEGDEETLKALLWRYR